MYRYRYYGSTRLIYESEYLHRYARSSGQVAAMVAATGSGRVY